MTAQEMPEPDATLGEIVRQSGEVILPKWEHLECVVRFENGEVVGWRGYSVTIEVGPYFTVLARRFHYERKWTSTTTWAEIWEVLREMVPVVQNEASAMGEFVLRRLELHMRSTRPGWSPPASAPSESRPVGAHTPRRLRVGERRGAGHRGGVLRLVATPVADESE